MNCSLLLCSNDLLSLISSYLPLNEIVLTIRQINQLFNKISRIKQSLQSTKFHYNPENHSINNYLFSTIIFSPSLFIQSGLQYIQSIELSYLPIIKNNENIIDFFTILFSNCIYIKHIQFNNDFCLIGDQSITINCMNNIYQLIEKYYSQQLLSFSNIGNSMNENSLLSLSKLIKLEKLKLIFCDYAVSISEQLLHNLFSSFSQLKSLSLYHQSIDLSTLSSLSSKSSLTFLHIFINQYFNCDQFLPILAELSALKELSIVDFNTLGDNYERILTTIITNNIPIKTMNQVPVKFMPLAAKIPTLKSSILTNYDSEFFSSLLSSTSRSFITTLDLFAPGPTFNLPSTFVQSNLFQNLQQLCLSPLFRDQEIIQICENINCSKNLQSFKIRYSIQEETMMKIVESFSQLQELFIFGAKNLTLSTLKKIIDNYKIRVLTFDDCRSISSQSQLFLQYFQQQYSAPPYYLHELEILYTYCWQTYAFKYNSLQYSKNWQQFLTKLQLFSNSQTSTVN